MKRLTFTNTGTWRILSASVRLEFTRSGSWRTLPPEAAEAFAAEYGEEDGNADSGAESSLAAQALEVQDIDPAKWDEFAPLFQRS